MQTKNLLKALAGIAVALTLTGCSNSNHSTNSSKPYSTKINTKKANKSIKKSQKSKASKTSNDSQAGIGGLTTAQYQTLANKTFVNNTYGYENVNGGKSTLNPKAWKTNKVVYSNLDSLNRTSKSNTGFLEKRNLANGALRVRQFVEPTGWHYNRRNGEQIYNRGHLIAYSVSAGINQDGIYNPQDQSGDQNNHKNLFTQTAYANQQLQTIYERKVRDALKANKKVIYQATAIFKGNERMARGVNLQAVSTDGTLNFNVFIFNVQNGYSFNYSNGSARKDNSVVVKALPPSLQSHYNNSRTKLPRSYTNKYKNRNYSNYPYKKHRNYNKKSNNLNHYKTYHREIQRRKYFGEYND